VLAHSDTNNVTDRQELDILLSTTGSKYTGLAFGSSRDGVLLHHPELAKIRTITGPDKFFACITFEPLRLDSKIVISADDFTYVHTKFYRHRVFSMSWANTSRPFLYVHDTDVLTRCAPGVKQMSRLFKLHHSYDRLHTEPSLKYAPAQVISYPGVHYPTSRTMQILEYKSKRKWAYWTIFSPAWWAQVDDCDCLSLDTQYWRTKSVGTALVVFRILKNRQWCATPLLNYKWQVGCLSYLLNSCVSRRRINFKLTISLLFNWLFEALFPLFKITPTIVTSEP